MKSSQLPLRMTRLLHLFWEYFLCSYNVAGLLLVHLNQIKVQVDYFIKQLTEHLLCDNHCSMLPQDLYVLMCDGYVCLGWGRSE